MKIGRPLSGSLPTQDINEGEYENMSKRNIRQIEYQERLTDMVKNLHDALHRNGNDYEKAIDKEEFLALFRIRCGVGLYASLRYFKDFVTIGFLTEVNEYEFKINVEYLKLNQFREKGVAFPEAQ
jgi:hypothetical protein